MKARILLSLAFLGLAGATQPAAAPSKLVGDYVEARTAAVFAGACHYNGEVVTTGRDAVMAWKITSGSWRGTDLSGVKAMAAVTSPVNLGDDHAQRKSELLVDSSATAAQVAALTEMLGAQSGGEIGQIVSIKRGPVSFTHDSGIYDVKAEGFAALQVQPMPNDECCSQPSLVWYTPLFHLDHRKVGYTNTATYVAGTVGDAWQDPGENNAFYGSFSFPSESAPAIASAVPVGR